MKAQERHQSIQTAIAETAKQIEKLCAAGKGIPAVEKNAARLRGTLRALEVQFGPAESAPES